eukprot:8644735-Lingulodinium_polyedra.AAC.1
MAEPRGKEGPEAGVGRSRRGRLFVRESQRWQRAVPTPSWALLAARFPPARKSQAAAPQQPA